MVTKRDQQVIDFLTTKNHKVARTTCLSELFYNGSLKVAQRRLKILTDMKELDKRRDPFGLEMIYCAKGRQILQLKHSLLYTDFLLNMIKNGAEIIDTIAEYSVDNVRSDGFVFYKLKNGSKYIAFVEVQSSQAHHQVDIKKYIDLYYTDECQAKWGTFPKVIVITNKKKTEIPEEFDVIVIKEDFSNISKLLGE